MKQASCPLCSTKPDALVLENGMKISEDFTIVTCRICDHKYTYFLVNVSEEGIYRDERYRVIDNRNSIFDKMLSFEYNRVVGKIKKRYGSEPAVLDFGSGKGKFLSLCKEAGFRTNGVETSEPRADFARKFYHLEIDSNYYSKGKLLGAPFDVISLFHVLEHLSKPKDLFTNLIGDNLGREGLVVVEVPNIDSWQSRWAGKNWLQLDVPRHINHFSQDSIISLIESCGLHPVEISYFSSHVGLLGMLRTCLGLVGYKGDLIHSLKNEKSILLYLLIGVLLPVSTVLETVASLFHRGGIIRIYASNPHAGENNVDS
ncbi:class I SAM-dependent methyltransferase [uncultured Imperialibacter sp.]|uniref:class I SAM-dependent methyltransferase n=1 Tax=uncultured Imperialibacter sp. TaxID=1672639 RepID=UPI0030D9CCC2|tara:strand:+ start:91417 stop:92361 length:945 start_codon:yes stop_codon:yes gene_type:complete